MTREDFLNSLNETSAPSLSPELLTLWYDGRGNWEQAHTIAQDIPGADGARLHAYLHRKEGDQFNARYWYNRSGTAMPQISLHEEWELLVQHFLDQ